MKKNFISAFLFVFTVSISFHPENKMKAFEWLKGSWSMTTKKGVIMESWQSYNDSTMLGETVMIPLIGETVVSEKLKLAFQSGDYYYISEITGQNNGQTVKFRITSHNEKGFVAENPEHDFPKRIGYELINKDSIHAFIDGGPSMPNKKADYYYSKAGF